MRFKGICGASRMLIFVIIFPLIAFNGYADEKEILVLKNIGRGVGFSSLMWCGNAGFLIYNGKFGTEWVDFDGNKVTISANKNDSPIGCTPDGQWVIYIDTHSWRMEEGRQRPEDMDIEADYWQGAVGDLYRYEVATGYKQKFAVVRDSNDSGILSPYNLSIFLGGRHNSIMEMPEPKWVEMWLTDEDPKNYSLDIHWFTDSSGIATINLVSNTYNLIVEFFGENGWTKEFELDNKILHGSINRIEAVDKDNRLYISTGEDYSVGERRSKTIYHFFRCKIKDRDLVCEKLGEFDEGKYDISQLIFLPAEDLIVENDEHNCIRRINLHHTHADAECIADTRYGNDTYEDIHLLDKPISPDGRWIAFRRGKEPPDMGKKPPEPGGTLYHHQYDLFVKELD